MALSTDVASSQQTGDVFTLTGDRQRYNEDSDAVQWVTAWAGGQGGGLSIQETLAAGSSVRFQVRLESEGPDIDHWGVH